MKRFILFSSSFILLILLIPSILSSFLGKPLFLLILKKHFESDIHIEQVHLTWLGPQTFHLITFSNNELKGSIQDLSSTVPFWQLKKVKQSFQLTNGTLTLPEDPQHSLHNVSITFQKNIIQANGKIMDGSLAIEGTLDPNQFHVTAQVQNFPTKILDPFVNHLSSILGHLISFNGSYSYKNNIGSFTGQFSSSNIDGSINGQLQNQVFTLKNPLSLVIHLKKELSEYLIHQMHLPISSITARNPIFLTIFPENTKISFKTFEIGKGILDLGKINLESQKIYLSLKKLFKNVALSAQIPFWFTPILFEWGKNDLLIDRFDVLIANSIHLCSWGNINHQNLDMMLGIPQDTLSRFFHLDNLNESFVLKIPVHGTLQEPDLDAGSALAKIISLSTTQELPGKTGKIFGKVVSKITQKKEEKNTPPPHRPFPWEK